MNRIKLDRALSEEEEFDSAEYIEGMIKGRKRGKRRLQLVNNIEVNYTYELSKRMSNIINDPPLSRTFINSIFNIFILVLA